MLDRATRFIFRTMKKIVLSFAALLLLCAPAFAAATPQTLGTFGFWRAFQVTENGQPVCYMTLTGKAPQPAAQKGKKGAAKQTSRGDITLMITHRPAEGSKDVVSYSAGTKFKPTSEASIHVGKADFNLFTQNDTAWSRDATTDHALTAAIRSMPSMTFSGESAKGDKLADTITLKGAAQAYAAIGKACGVAAPEEPKPAAKTVAPAKKKK